MRDHQLFEKTVLPNGITLYTYQDRFRIASLEILLPVGSGHSHPVNGFLPGSAHFLEHVQLTRSHAFPLPYQLDQELGLRGGHGDGSTFPTVTSHWMDVPAQELSFAVNSMIDRVFHPIFEPEDLATERKVIRTERNQHKFYPGKNEAGQYYYREFLNDVFYPLEQIFGSDEDLEALTIEKVVDMHTQVTQSPDIRVLAIGNSDFAELKDRLAALPTKPTDFQLEIKPTCWGKKDFCKVYFDSIAQPTLRTAWIHPRMSYQEFQGVSFIISLLINATHGPLYQEFREEKGWVYSIDAYCTQREYTTLFGLTFPVNSDDQVQYIKEYLADRIQKAVSDQTLVEHEVIRFLRNQVYNYQTAGEIISSASHDLMNYGCIHTEKEWLLAIQAMASPEWRQELVSKYFRAEDMGSICFMPERRRKVPLRNLPIVQEEKIATIRGRSNVTTTP